MVKGSAVMVKGSAVKRAWAREVVRRAGVNMAGVNMARAREVVRRAGEECPGKGVMPMRGVRGQASGRRTLNLQLRCCNSFVAGSRKASYLYLPLSPPDVNSCVPPSMSTRRTAAVQSCTRTQPPNLSSSSTSKPKPLSCRRASKGCSLSASRVDISDSGEGGACGYGGVVEVPAPPAPKAKEAEMEAIIERVAGGESDPNDSDAVGKMVRAVEKKLRQIVCCFCIDLT